MLCPTSAVSMCPKESKIQLRPKTEENLGATSPQEQSLKMFMSFLPLTLNFLQMTVPARIKLPKIKIYGSSFVNLMVWLAAVFVPVSVLISITTIRICHPWLTIHFLISHHILSKLNADLLYLCHNPQAAKICCSVYWKKSTSSSLVCCNKHGEGRN